ncbi:non-ribosomal peptide synthetase [Bradyrhizobium symbiodeficiens]|uniref:Non-ribosomal peptide synthetase n=1 Tax=Bradyrhizobium symbiodeficiens TaxID=1404367 RepID=A0A6G8ZZM4_9BRAD|nr:non-ribosomal peptide synthetase [Bradyrhizobium symbiodeficiens]QIP05504.1 amino acid adenylation domain-containing protein [Bradyrhizobium symbiodeficiens]
MLRQSNNCYDLCPIQAGMLLHATMRTGSGVDVQQIVSHLESDIDVDRLVCGWRYVTQRHPALRTSFRWLDCPQPLQEVHSTVELPIARLDWSGLDRLEEERQLAAFLLEDRQRGFDLGLAPLSRLTFIRTASQMVMVWTFHHILLDGRAFPLILKDVFGFPDSRYAAQRPDVSVAPDFRAHVEWLNARDEVASRTYWKEFLAGFRAPVRLWVERAGSGRSPIAEVGEFGHAEAEVASERARALEQAASAANVTINTLLQGAWGLLLGRLSGERDVVFGATRACRKSGIPGADGIIGLLINTLPVRVDLDPDADLAAWLAAIRSQSLSIRPHEHASLAKVQGWSDVERGRPLFESIVVYEHLTLDAQLKALGDEWQRRSFRYIGQTNFPLALIAYGGEQLLLRIEYARDRFDDDVAQRMLRYLEVLLIGMAEGILIPGDSARLGSLGILPDEERAQLLSGRVTATYDTSPLHSLFEARASATPDSEAVAAGEQRLTYRELNARANRIAHALRQKGVQRNDIVGLAVERNADVAIGILAILKAGAAYLPLDPDYPPDRLAFIVGDAKARLVLASSKVRDSLQLGAAECLDMATAGDGLPEANPDVASVPADLAYVIYTSGSTGKPKGVLVTHANVARLFSATDPWFSFGPGDVWTLFHSYAFDFSVWELWGALLYGGRLVIVPYWISRDPAAFRKLLVEERVTILNQTPSAFRQLIQADLDEAPAAYALREIIFGGEALELQSLKPWIGRYGDGRPRLVNMYGITETTVHVTYRPITRADVEACRGSVIGEPIPDLYIRLLDERGEPVPVGVPGEIWVGGAGVANGYLNRPELNAQRFVAYPLDPTGSARLYRAGDLARRLPDGELEFLGRIDAQVKIRGFRIELGEIEATLNACPGVADAAVIVREDVPGDKRLVAYVVGKDPGALNPDDLRETLARVLPAHMIPAYFVALAAIPLNANGKLDKSRLPEPRSSAPQEESPAFIEPQSENERKIAAVWAAVLRLDRVGVDDNFFALGGDSILSIQVVANCRRAGINNLATRDLFEYPTVAALARCVDSRVPIAATSVPRALDQFTLTPIQRWFFEQNFSEQHYWNQAFLFEIPSDLDHSYLKRALEVVCRRHDAFRTRFRRDGERWEPALADNDEAIAIVHHDLSSLPKEKLSVAIEQSCSAAQALLDIERGPLLCAALIRTGGPSLDRLLLAAHHLAIDGVSWRIFLEDLESAYESLRDGKSVEFPQETTGYQTWATSLCEYVGQDSVHAAARAWQDMIAKPFALLPVSCAEIREADAGSLLVELTEAETAALLQEVPAVYRTQINDVLFSALAIALQRSTGGSSFLIETEGHGREDIGDGLDLSRTIGWFTSLFPLRLDLPPGESIDTVLKSVKEQVRTVPDRGLTYGLLRYCSADPTTRSSLAYRESPQLLFNYLGQFDQVTRNSRLFAFATESTGRWHAEGGHRTHALEVLAQIRSGKLRAEWIFGQKQMGRANVQTLASDFIAALRTIIDHCRGRNAGGRTPSDLPLLSARQAEIDRLWRLHPGFADAYPLTPMQRLFYVMEQAGSSVGLEQWQFRIEGQLDPARLHSAFGQVIARHTILRTGFSGTEGGEPVQVVMPDAVLPWHEEDWRHLDLQARSNATKRVLERDEETPFDLSRPPLMRVQLLRLESEEWQLLWTTHHLCIDGWSWPRLFGEIAKIYSALSSGVGPALGSPLDYVQYVRWLANQKTTSLGYWEQALSDFASPTPICLGPVAETPARKRGGQSQTIEIRTQLSKQATQSLRTLGQSAGSTLSTLVQAGWALLLGFYAETQDVVFGATLSGRSEHIDGIDTLIGPCVTNVPVRVKVDLDEPLRLWLSRLQGQQLDLAQHQFLPVDVIQGISKVPWHQRLFDSLLVFQNYQVDVAIERLGRDARLIPVQTPEATNYALTMAVSPGEQLTLRLIYNEQRVDRGTIEAIASDLPVILEALALSGSKAIVADILASLPVERRGKAAAVARATNILRLQAGAPISVAESETEQKLAAIWTSLLTRSDIDVDDNFFDAGGQSLLLLRMHRLLESTFERRIQIVKLLELPTIRLLAAYLNSSDEVGQAGQHAEHAAERASRQRAAFAKQRAKARLV